MHDRRSSSPSDPVTLHMTRWLRGKGTIAMPTGKLTKTIIEAAIAGFESQKRGIDAEIAELRSLLNGATSSTSSPADQPAAESKSRKFSAATIKRMREAQKLRWAKIKSEAAPQAPAPAPKPKRKLSAAARATLAANLKKARAAKLAKAKSAATKETASAPAHAPKLKRKLSAAGRAAIIAATKRMWAAKRAAAKQA